MHDTKTMGIHSNSRRCFSGALTAVLFERGAKATAGFDSFLTNSKKSDDRHVQRTRPKHGRRSYLSEGIGGDSERLLEREPLRSKDRGLLSYNIDIIYLYTCICMPEIGILD